MNNEKLTYDLLKTLFQKSNDKFLKNNKQIIEDDVNERCLCGALMLEMNSIKNSFKWDMFKQDNKYLSNLIRKYYVDVEYNRNRAKYKTILNNKYEVIRINCDLIMHSRGRVANQDNLIAIEMKKQKIHSEPYPDDITRLKALTKCASTDPQVDQCMLPEHVCGYELGIYYIIDREAEMIKLLYFKDGEQVEEDVIAIQK